jgi:hypothetical protein
MPLITLPFEFEADKSTGNPEIVVNLRIADKDSYQLVYASQLYGTFFSVFAKLNITGDVLNSVQLSLVNYKGTINLGLLPETVGTWRDGEEGLEFTVHLKGNAGKHQYNEEDEVIVDCKNTPIADLKSLVVRRQLHPMHAPDTSLVGQLSKGVFDSEFFKRDGAFVTNRYHLDELYKAYDDQVMPVRKTGVCNTTYVTIT